MQLLRDQAETGTSSFTSAPCGKAVKVPSVPVEEAWLSECRLPPGPTAALTEDAHSVRGWPVCENSPLLHYIHQHAHFKSLADSKRKTPLMRNVNTCVKKIILHLQSFKFGLRCIFISTWLPTSFVCS